jgi:tRNA (5-methylaminomethyl-2-thiouridylate)-methyltransferase
MSIAVLLSGGVDSSVALYLLKKRGYEKITAFYLKIWLEDEIAFLGECPWEEDLEYARRVCDSLDVPLEIVSLQREYFDRVVTYAIDELKAGRTPSPDIFCNQRIKFGLFADRIGAEFPRIASGHYATLRHVNGTTLLARSPDPVKDQTYFLSHQTQPQLSGAIFPIGHLRKDDVRRIAADTELPTANRADSQGICFLGKIKYTEFVRHYLGDREGRIVDADTGAFLGSHNGCWFYTIGQRQGLGLGSGPWYVSGKNIDENIVFVMHKRNDGNRLRSRFSVCRTHWISHPPDKRLLTAKVRHGPALTRCTLDHLENDRYSVELEEPDGGLAPGQFTVFYDGDICLGGAMIDSIATI